MKNVTLNVNNLLFIFCIGFLSFFNSNKLQAQTITTAPVALSFCSCAPVNVSYTATGVYNIGNIFLVQLSNAVGNFAGATNIGNINSNALNGTIPCVIPCNTPYGTGYRIRILSNSPFVIGSDNGANITINPSPIVSIALTNGNCVDTLTAVVQGANVGVPNGNKYYITNSPPWGSPNNVNEMNGVFGVGNWIPANFGANAATIFVPGTQFVFLEGSDGNALALNTFVTANIALIQNWVFAGGRLFLNSAPNQGGVMNWGFAGSTLNYINLIPPAPNAVPGVNISNLGHPINVGPYVPLDPNGVYTGPYFAHANVVNAGTTLIHSSANSNFSVLSEKVWGAGLALFGGMTTSNWHNNVGGLVNAHAVNLRKNILNYTAGSVIQPTYTYLWNTGATTPKIIPVASGIYTVTVTSTNGCTGTATFNYTAIAPPPVVNITASGGLCTGGIVVLNAGPGFTSYLWDNALISQTRTIAAPGTYWVTVTNAQGCTASDTITITPSPNINLAAAASPPIACNGGTTTIFAIANGGVPAFQFSFNGGPYGPSNQLVGAVAGIYTVTVLDAAGCTKTTVVNISQPPPMLVNLVAPPLPCNGLTNLTVNANGGLPAYQYALNAGPYQFGNQFINVGAGVYTVTVKDANNCTVTSVINIAPINSLSVAVSNITNVTCNPLCNGTAQATGVGGAPAYTYAITAPGVINVNSGAITALCAGTYTVTVTDAVLCTATTSFTVTQPPALNVAISNITNVSCAPLCNGSALATASGGTPGYLYSITAPGVINVTGNITALCAGSYTVTASDANGCTATTTFTVTQLPALTVNISNIVNVSCNGQCNGTAQATSAGGTPGYVYSISAPGVINVTGAISALCAGIYTVTTTDAAGCTSTTSFTITAPPALSLNISNIVNVTCSPLCNGTAQAAAVGGTPSYLYSITAPGVINITGAITGLCAGGYTVTVTDANLCTATSSFTVTQPPAIVVTVTATTNPSCAPGCDGTASVVSVGGIGVITYSILPVAGPQIPLGTFTGLCAGINYVITATDANGCTGTTNVSLSTPNGPIVAVSNITDVSCLGLCNATAQATASGGTPAYSYAITLPGIININTGAISGLCAGSYTVTVTDANSCVGTISFSVTQPNLLTIGIGATTAPNCVPGCNGIANTVTAGGTPAYSYTISGGAIINGAGIASNLCAGITYTITVTDSKACTASTTILLATPNSPTVTVANITNVTCNGLCNGTGQANAVGGLAAYSFSINAPGVININTGAISGLCAGIYSVTVTDANLCTATTTFTVTEAPLLTVTVANIVNVSCSGLCDGTAQANAVGGTNPISYGINAPGVIAVNLGSITALCAGTYTVTATDANLCTATTTFTVTQPLSLAVTVANIVDVNCNGSCDGTAQATAVGGTNPISYGINAPGIINVNTGAITGLCVGTYTVTATDANLCTATTIFTVNQPAILSIVVFNIVNVTCNGSCNGTSQSTALGGTLPYVYAISAPGVTIAATGANSALCAGTYTVTVTDANFCTASTTFTVTAPPLATVTVSNITDVSCNGSCDGTAQANAAGGVNPFLFTITAPGAIDVNTGAISALCAGSYTVTATDANLCTATTVFTVSEPTPLTVAVSNITMLPCFGLCTGTAQALGSGGMPNYTYAISAPGIIDLNTGSITALCAGTYLVTITDANSCTATTLFNVTQPAGITVTISNTINASCNAACDGTAQTIVVGGNPPYTFSITAPGIINVNTGLISGLCAGTYTVTVTDANNCIGTSTVIVTEPPVLSIAIITTTPVTCVPGCDGTATTATVGGTPAYAYTISGGAVINAAGTASNLCAGIVYTITVTDANGCTSSTTIQLAAPIAPTVTVSNITNVTCNGLCDGTSQAAGAGGTPAYIYAISAPGVIDANNGSISALCVGTYTVTVTDANLCTGTTTFNVTEPTLLTVAVSNITNVTCNAFCNGTAQATGAGGTIAYTYAITAPGVINVNTGAISALCAGSYTVTVTDANLCTATTTFSVTEPTAVVTTIVSSTNPTCTPGCDGIATVTGSGGTGPIVFTISPAAGPQLPLGTFTGLCAGINYVITATDANGCTGTTNISFVTPNAPTVTVSNITNVSCNGVCDGTAQSAAVGGTPGYSYSITAPGIIDVNTGAITALCAGSYTVTVTDANSCVGTTNFVVSQPNVLTVDINLTTAPTCVPGCDGTATTATVGGTPAYAYTISGGAVINAAGTASNLCAGIVYTITVTDANACTGTTTVQLTAPTAPTITINTTTPVTCVPGCDGTATTATVGGTPAYAYTISGGAAINLAGTASNLCAGIVYTITVTDANGCSSSTTIQLAAPIAPTVTVSNITNVTCNGLCDGTSQAAGAGGTPAYIYAISAPGVIDANTGSISALCVGTYTVTVTDANLCTGTTTFNVTEPTLLTVAVSNITNVTCNAFCNGTAQATGAGGTIAYTYAITAPGVINVNTGAISALCAGSYTVTVTDANLCTATTTFSVTEPTAVVTTIVSSTNPTCTPGCDGIATVTGSGGTGPIVFTISPAAGPQLPLGTFTGLCAGINYVITATDANGCTGTTNISLSTPNAPTVTVSNITNVSCNGVCDGTAQSAAVGGTPGYSYSITAPGIIDVNTGAITALCAGGYTVTVTDANSCVGTTNFVVSQPNVLTVDINLTTAPTCVPGCDGTATTATVGGTPAYAYTISGGAAINAAGTASNLCAGIVYTITVTDANACTGTTTVQLTAPNSPTITINTTTPVTCVPGCDGTATTATVGGTPAYAYTISGGAVINAAGTASNLCGGIVYTITVTDANACTGTTTIQLIAPNSPTITINASTAPSCVPGCDGTATTATVGGTPAYAYAISGGAAINAAGTASNLCAGIVYTITVTDANACTGTTTVQLTAPNSPTITINTTTPVTCVPGCDGTATTATIGGTPAYAYAISGGAAIDALGNASNLCAGIVYTITVTDANACTGTTTVQLTAPNPPTITINTTAPVTCVPGCDGTATTATVGGTPAYVYAISGGAAIDALGNASNLCAGIVYTITVTDANACTGTTTVQLTAPNSPTITINTTTPTTCVPGCDGTATTATVGGTPAYAYAISGGAAIDALGTASNLCAGIVYTITVTDASGCTGTTTVQLTAPSSPTVTITNTTAPSCTPGCDGTLTVTGAGGNGPIVFTISPAAGPQLPLGTFTGLCAGINYVITATDANGCTGTTNISLSTPNAPTVTVSNITNVSCNGVCDGTAQSAAVGGTPGYSYSITAPGIIDVNTGAITALCAGSYTVTVTDANSCVGTTNFVVSQPNVLTVDINLTTAPTCVPGCDGTATTITAGGTAAYAYSISGGAAINAAGTASNLCAGIVYTITVTDANACTGTTTVQLTAPNSPTITINASTAPSCVPGCDGTATTATVGGTPAYAYIISGGAVINAAGTASNLCGGIVYTITVTDANSCSATTTIQLIAPNSPTITINASTAPSCVPGCDGTATTATVGGTPAYAYAISGGAVINAAGTASNLCAGIVYTITVTDANACTGTTTVQLTAPNSPTITINTTTPVTCVPGCDGTATTATVGGTPAYAYAISGGAAIDALGNASNLCAGIVYTITVTDANACTGTTTVQLTAPNSPTITINTTTPVTCVPGCDGTATTATVGGTPAYAYAISGGAAINVAGTASNLCAGIVYTITVTDANACTGTTTVQLTAPNSPTITINTTTPTTCVPGCDGTATTATVGGTPAYAYAISGGAAIDALGTASNLCAGIVYTITVTDASGCTGTTTVQLTAPSSPTVTITNTTAPSCTPGCDGTLTVTGAGGNGPIVFTISPAAGPQLPLGTFTGLCAGINYVITATDANGCTGTTNISLSTPNAPTVTVSNITNVSCNGVCDGTAQSAAVGGTPGYSYSITAPGIIDVNTGAITALCAGSYTVTVTDANSCVGTTNFVVSQPNVLTVDINLTTAPTCVPGCDGTATTITAGGTAAYAYTISGGAAINAAGTASNLCAGIVYTITVTDANACTGTTTVQLTAPTAPTITINTTTPVTCVPGCDGTATTATVGGTPAYAYTISGGAVINAAGTASNLCGGIVYTITVTDANACTGTTTIQLIAPNSPTITINASTAPSCVPGCDGTATTATVGGTPAYAYAISGGAVINAAGTASNLCGGIVYTITVTDANACTGTTTVQLTAPNSPTITINTTTPVTCVPGCDGTATTATIGGTPAYAYAISGGAAIDALGNASNLCAGIVYTITVTDANGCTGTTTVQLIGPNSPTITINTTTPVTCVPGCDGTATTATVGGAPAYVYAISGGAAAISAIGDASNLCAGIVYTITVTDANGCTGTTTVQLTAPNSPTIVISSSTAPTCVPGCDGTATTATAGGTPAYAYAISGGATIDVLGNASSLCAAIIYTITVTDANGCSATTTVQLSTANSPVITINTSTTPSCVPGCDGTATTAVLGGNPSYTYAITGGANIDVLGAASNLCVGTIYTITVTDAGGCTGTTTLQLGAPNSPTVTVTAFTNVTVFAGADGTITVAGAGGTPGYLYTISPAIGVQAPAGNFTNLTANPGPTCYTITVTDANGCTATTVQCITQPPIPNLVVSIILTDETCFGKCDGTITASTTGGAAPYNYLLAPGNIPSGTGIYPNLCVGTYTITSTDINNATGSTIVIIGGPSQIQWTNAIATDVSCFGAANGSMSVNATGGLGGFMYSITPLAQANILGVFTPLTPQCYTITATDINGCTLTATLCIAEPPQLSFAAVVAQDNSCFGGLTGTITAAATGGNPLPNYTYALLPGGQANQTGQFTGLGAGSYTVIVTDGNGCTATTGGIVITEPPIILYNTVNLHEVYCYGDATGSIAVVASGGTGAITFSITPNATQQPLGFFKDLLAGTYTITATDANGCTLSTQATIVQNPELRITSLTVVEPICAYDTTGVLDVTATGGTAPITFSLNNGTPKLSGLFTGLPIGVYQITLIDDLGCRKDTNLILSGPTLVGATLLIEDTKCVDSKDGRVTVVGTGGRGGYKYYITPGLNINKTGKFYDLASGTYTLRVVDTVGCEYQTVFTINPPSNPLGNTMTKQDLACTGKGNEGTATANVFGGQPPYVYEWSTSPIQNSSMASSLYFGWYNVLISDANGCEYRDSVYIEEGPCCDVSFIPNAFSPNGDNNNDEFRVFSTAGIQLIMLEVYDRWGQKLWTTSDWKRGWDGTVDGKEAEVSTYFYEFKYICTRDGKTYMRKGDVTLIR